VLKEAGHHYAEFITSKQLPLPSWLSDMDDHSGACLPYRHPELIQVCCSLDQHTIQTAIDQRCQRLPTCVRAKDVHFKHIMWTQLYWPCMTVRC